MKKIEAKRVFVMPDGKEIFENEMDIINIERCFEEAARRTMKALGYVNK